jgi:hypothetical protein
MATPKANAYPRKHFFFEMFTRDISLEDCILDLIDNSIDGLIRSRKIPFADSLLNPEVNGNSEGKTKLPSIDVSYSNTRFQINDTCGGISRKRALTDVFNFGHAPGEGGGALGVYGIGLKRAIFKLGNHFQMNSRTESEGFSVDLDLKKWVARDNTLEDWRIPLQYTVGASSKEAAGTDIRITQLRPEVMMRLNDGTLAQRLNSIISQTYGLFIDRYVRIILNGRKVEPFHIPIGDSDQITPAHDEYQDGTVNVKLFASLAARVKQAWRSEPAGWYALCNGRIVVAADKTDLTGWGSLGFPQFHDGKHRGFVGVAFFESTDPLALPWTTTKRGLYRESPVYLHARNRMIGVARPIIKFLDSLYKPDSPEEPAGRAIANQVTRTGLQQIASRPTTPFSVHATGKKKLKTTVRVQYDAEMAEVQRIRTHVKKPGWSAGDVGKFTFDHYLKTECPDDRSL